MKNKFLFLMVVRVLTAGTLLASDELPEVSSAQVYLSIVGDVAG